MGISAGLSSFSTIFGLVVGVISLLALVINVLRSHLPSSKIKMLESLLEETETCFKKGVEDGLLTEVRFVRRTEGLLVVLRSRTRSLRARAYGATTLGQDYAEFFRGTSLAIGKVCRRLKDVRAAVITSSEEGRLRLTHTRSDHPAPPTLSVYRAAQGERPLDQDRVLEIPRPHSCPAVLVSWEPDDVRHILFYPDSLCDSSIDDRGVQTANAHGEHHLFIRLSSSTLGLEA